MNRNILGHPLLFDFENDNDAYFLLIDFKNASCVQSVSTDLSPDMLIESKNSGELRFLGHP